jgi:single-stranded-DNA-specific exonuclease
MIGTIADRVMLLGENRIFCAQGLKLFSHVDEPWVRYFCPVKEGGMDIPRITGEVIPTIASASYRDPAMGIGLLTSQSVMYINETIAQLKGVTAERRMGIDALFSEARSAVKVLPSIVVSIVPATNQLYLGSVAARLRDSYGRTALLIGMKNGKGHGELRSHDVNLYDMLYRFKDFFIDFGGHHRAAGFTMVQDKLDSVVDGIIAYCEETTAPRKKEKSDEMPDVLLKREDIRILMPLAPFGEGNPAPLLTDGSMVYTVNNKFEIMVKETRG